MGVSLSELFDKNPQDLTRAEREALILRLRESRAIYFAEKQSAKAQGRRAKTSKNLSPDKMLGLDLGEIDFSSALEKKE